MTIQRLDTSRSAAHYGLPESLQTDPVATKKASTLPDAAVEAVSNSKKVQSPGILTNFVNWIGSFFGVTPKEETESAALSYVSQDRMLKHIQETSRLVQHQKEMLDDSYNPEDLWLQAQLAQIKLRENQVALDRDEIQEIHHIIRTYKSKLDKLMEGEHDAAKKALIFGHVQLGTAVILIATTIAAAAISILTVNPVPLIITAAQVGAGMASALSQLVSSIYKYKSGLFEADLMGMQEKRRVGYSVSGDILDQMRDSSEAVSTGYKNARALEDKKHQAIRNFSRN